MEEHIATVILSVAPQDRVEAVSLPSADLMRAAAIALRRFRKAGYRVFDPGAFVQVRFGTSAPLSVSVREVIEWLKQPEQKALVASQETA